MIRIAVTDDHPLVVDGIRGIIEETPQYTWFGGFNTARATSEGLNLEQPDLLFLDINIPDLDGISLCAELIKAYPQLKIIALSSYSELPMVKKMLAQGARGYVLKTAGREVILTAMEQVLNNSQYLDPEIEKAIVSSSLNGKRQREFIPKLTRREKEVLRLIIEEYTTNEIADKLFLNHKTVESHRMNLIQKLGAKNTAGLVRIALEKSLLD
jgi:DNA-binding NarL/FixJ family response regulator